MVEYFFWAVSSRWGFGFQIWISFLGGWYSTGVVLELFRTGFVKEFRNSLCSIITTGNVRVSFARRFTGFLQLFAGSSVKKAALCCGFNVLRDCFEEFGFGFFCFFLADFGFIVVVGGKALLGFCFCF